MSTGAHSDVQIDTGHLRVTRWEIEPGGIIPMHRHEHEYVVVPLVDAVMHVRTAAGDEVTAPIATGQSYTREAGAEHQIENRSTGRIVFIEVERIA